MLVEAEEFTLFEHYRAGQKNCINNRRYLEASNTMAANLQEQLGSLAPSAWVGLCCSNDPYWYAALFAIMKSGYRVVLINPTSGPDAVRQIVADAGITGVVCDPGFGPLGVAGVTLADLLVPTTSAPNVCWADKLAICTTGTTSASKVVVYDAWAMTDQVKAFSAQFALEGGNAGFLALLDDGPLRGRRLLAMLPFCHIFGFIYLMAFALHGCTLVMPHAPTIQGAIEAIKQNQVFLMPYTPILWKKILNVCVSRYGEVTRDNMTKLLGPQFKALGSGGASLEAEIRKAYLDAGIYCMVGIGSTETGVITTDFPTAGSLESLGPALAGSTIELAILLPNGSLAKSGRGELLVYRDELFCSLLVNGQEEPWERFAGRYFRTGDIVDYADNGLLYFAGRAKNLIVGNTGENISIEELERHFAALGLTGDKYCIIELDDRAALAVYYQVQDGGKDAIVEAARRANAELPTYKKVARAVFTNDPLPLTAKGEIDRRAVAKACARSQDMRVLVH
jgi:long-subunit acyl-CoA synthetase (AMP-forming)